MNDYTGQVFGRLTVTGDGPKDSGSHRTVMVRCECGTEKAVQLYHVLKGRTVSCGCWKTTPRKLRKTPEKPRNALDVAMDFMARGN